MTTTESEVSRESCHETAYGVSSARRGGKSFRLAMRLGRSLGLLILVATLSNCASTGSGSGSAFSAAMSSLRKHGVSNDGGYTVAVLDFTQPSYQKRMTIHELDSGRSTRHLVAHGVGSGSIFAKDFSNRTGSKQSSLGLYRVGSLYHGKHGRALRLHGLEKGLNDKAFSRGIVLHGADYVSYETIMENLQAGQGLRLGLSAGCPAVSREDMDVVLSRLQPGSYLYIYAGQRVQGSSLLASVAGGSKRERSTSETGSAAAREADGASSVPTQRASGSGPALLMNGEFMSGSGVRHGANRSSTQTEGWDERWMPGRG